MAPRADTAWKEREDTSSFDVPPGCPQSGLQEPDTRAGTNPSAHLACFQKNVSYPGVKTAGSAATSTRKAALKSADNHTTIEPPGGEPVGGLNVPVTRSNRRSLMTPEELATREAGSVKSSSTGRSVAGPALLDAAGRNAAPQAEPGVEAHREDDENGDTMSRVVTGARRPRGNRESAENEARATEDRIAEGRRGGHRTQRSGQKDPHVPQGDNQEAAELASQRIRDGDALARGQALVGHGKFTKWLDVNCTEISRRTAGAYMQAAGDEGLRVLLDDPDWQPDANLTLKHYLKSKARPRPDRRSTESGNATETGPTEPLSDHGPEGDHPPQRGDGRDENRRDPEQDPADRHPTSTSSVSSRDLDTPTAGEDGNEATSAEDFRQVTRSCAGSR